MFSRMVVMVLAVLVGFALLHALAAAWLTFSGPRARLWERLALMSTLTTMLLALVSLIPAYLVRGFEANALALGYPWAGALVLEAVCVFAVRRASPRLAAVGMFLVLFAPPMAWLAGPIADRIEHRYRWRCVVNTVAKR